MIGGVELGGTKCVLAVANNPLDIINYVNSDIVSIFSDVGA